MAEATTTPIIRTVDELLGLAVPENERQQVLQALSQQNYHDAQSMIRGYISAYIKDNRAANTSGINIEAILEDSRRYLTQEPKPTGNAPQPTEAVEGLGDAGAALAGGVFAGLTADRSKSTEIIWELNMRKMTAEKQWMFEQLQNALNTPGQDNEAKRILNSLRSDTLLDAQVQQLKVQVQEAGGDARALGLIDKRHKAVLEKRGRKKGKTDEFDPDKFFSALKAVKNEDVRKQMFDDLFTRQHLRNSNDLYSIITRGTVFKRSILAGSVKKKLAEEGKKRQKARQQKPEENQEFTEEDDSPSYWPNNYTQTFSRQVLRKEISPPFSVEIPIPGPQAPSPTRGIGIPKNIAGGLAKKGGSAALKFFLANPAVSGTIIACAVGFLLVFFLIIVVVLLIKSYQDFSPFQLTQLSCGNQPTRQQLASTSLMDSHLYEVFHLHFDTEVYAKGDVKDPTALGVMQNAYNAVCILFGQIANTSYNPTIPNTFGKLLIENYGAQTGEPIAKMITFIAMPSTTGHPDCSIALSSASYPTDSNNPNINWNFYTPDKCISVYQFQFRFAHALGLSLLYQQEYKLQQKTAKDGSSPPSILDTIKAIFPDFASLTIQGGKTINLPTAGCTKAMGTQDFLPQCFADMVGEYLTYPYYLDGFGLHGAFIAGTPQEVDIAANAGMSYVINYSYSPYAGNPSENALDPTSTLGKEFIKYNIKSFLDVHRLIGSHQDYKDCAWTNANTQALTTLVQKYYTNTTLGGYWIKDDDIGCDMKPALKQIYQTIRSIDNDQNHVVMAGYGVASSMSNYEDGVADVLAFYPYPAYNEGHTVEWHIQHMIASEKAATPAGKTPPPWVGIYQAFFASDGHVSEPSKQEIIDSVNTYIKYGATSVIAFSVGHPGDVDQTAGNNSDMLAIINAVRDRLGLGALTPQ